VEILVPQRFVYGTAEPAPISDVIASLSAAETLLHSTGPLLEGLIPGLTIDRIDVSVREISQESPLREILLATLVATFQKDLEKDVPPILEKLTGIKIPDHYDSIVALGFCVLLFYGVDFVYTQVNRSAFSKRIRDGLDGTIKDLALEFAVPEERVRTILENKYGPSQVRRVATAAISFFTPSKRQSNASVTIGTRRIEPELVGEIPSAAQIESGADGDVTSYHYNVLIELHAQDVDRAKRGWAAVVPEISSKRLKMELYPPIKPEDLYTKSRVRGDISLVSKRGEDGSLTPAIVHLQRIIDAQ
jgi:hypothetical protein